MRTCKKYIGKEGIQGRECGYHWLCLLFQTLALWNMSNDTSFGLKVLSWTCSWTTSNHFGYICRFAYFASIELIECQWQCHRQKPWIANLQEHINELPCILLMSLTGLLILLNIVEVVLHARIHQTQPKYRKPLLPGADVVTPTIPVTFQSRNACTTKRQMCWSNQEMLLKVKNIEESCLISKTTSKYNQIYSNMDC